MIERRAGQHSICINDQWRVCFVWEEDGPYEVEITDYHEEHGNMVKNGMRPIHPGEILLEEFLQPSEPRLNANTLAKALSVPANRITAILKGQRGMTGDTALRLGTFFNTPPGFWMNLQKAYELRLAEQTVGRDIKKTVKPRAA